MLAKFGNNLMGDQTTPYQTASCWGGTKALITFSVPITIVLGIGTGGYLTAEYCKQRKDGFTFNRQDARSAQAATVATTADHLARIKSVLKLTVVELADCIGVSRQAIYNWKSGADIKANNAAKLESLKSATDVILAASLPASPLLLARKLRGGKTLLEIISGGGDGSEAARSLVQMVKQESEARKALDERFANRQIPAHPDNTFGVVG
jgi:DNA-binding XRE family transcriptional regulator